MVIARFALFAAACLVAAIFFGSTASAATFTAACTGATGDPASLATAIAQANSLTGADTVELGGGCVYALATVDNSWYGANGLPPIASQITIRGNGATIARQSPIPFRLFFVGADPGSPSTLGYVSPGPGQLTLEDVTLSGGLAKGGDSDGGGGGAGMGGAIFSQGIVRIVDSTLAENEALGGSANVATAGEGGGGLGTSASGTEGGGFGAGTFGGGIGGTGGQDAGGGGGAGFATGENGGNANCCPHSAGGAGGGPATGTGGVGGVGGLGGTQGPGGDGSGGGGTSFGIPSSDTGGRFGQGGQGIGGGGAGGGVGGGGGAGSDSGGGGGFGGGGGYRSGASSLGAGGSGGFGGGGGGSTHQVGGAGFGGGTPEGTSGGGGAGMGGAIFNMQGELTIDDSTIAGNSALGGADNVTDHGKGIGGAVFNMSGSFTATDSTFAANTAAYYAAQIYNLVYDAHTARTAQTTLRDTIVAEGFGPVDLASVKTAYISPSPPLGSANADLSHFDLVRSVASPSVEEMGTVTGTPLTADPLLGALGSNGGPTKTMPLLPGSPAIDSGSSFGLRTDQRGEPRPSDFPAIANTGDGSDIGAFEAEAPNSATPSAAATLPPVLGPVRATPAVFAVAPAGKRHRSAAASKARKVRRGTTFSYSLSEPARVTFSIERMQRTFTKVGALVQSGGQGADLMAFSGHIGRRALVPGRYRVTLVATDAAGNHSQARRATFRIVKTPGSHRR